MNVPKTLLNKKVNKLKNTQPVESSLKKPFLSKNRLLLYGIIALMAIAVIFTGFKNDPPIIKPNTSTSGVIVYPGAAKKQAFEYADTSTDPTLAEVQKQVNEQSQLYGVIKENSKRSYPVFYRNSTDAYDVSVQTDMGISVVSKGVPTPVTSSDAITLQTIASKSLLSLGYEGSNTKLSHTTSKVFSNGSRICNVSLPPSYYVTVTEISCADLSELQKQSNLTRPFYQALLNSEYPLSNVVSLYVTPEDVKESSTTGYRTASVSIGYAAGVVGGAPETNGDGAFGGTIGFFYQKNGEWHFLVSAQIIVNCSTYTNNADARLAYIGSPCWDETAKSNSTVL